jgi:hypothetical protein
MMFRQRLLDLLALLYQSFYVVWFDQLKSSLGMSLNLNESIEHPFRQKVWLGSVHV